MRQGHGVELPTRQAAKQYAREQSAACGGPGEVIRHHGSNGGNPHYHGVGPNGKKLRGHSWWSRVRNLGPILFEAADENGNGEIDPYEWFDIFGPLPYSAPQPGGGYTVEI